MRLRDPPGLPLLHGVLRRRVTAGVAPFDLQPVEDPLRRVPLLLWLLLVLLQHLVDPCRVRAQHRLLTTRSSPISRWLHVHEHLHQRSPVDAVLPAHSVLLAQRLLQFPSGDARLDSRRPPLATSDRGHGTFQPPISSPIPQRAGRQFRSIRGFHGQSGKRPPRRAITSVVWTGFVEREPPGL